MLLGFAEGALTAALAFELVAEADEIGGVYVALATVAGFRVAYLISEV